MLKVGIVRTLALTVAIIVAYSTEGQSLDTEQNVLVQTKIDESPDSLEGVESQQWGTWNGYQPLRGWFPYQVGGAYGYRYGFPRYEWPRERIFHRPIIYRY